MKTRAGETVKDSARSGTVASLEDFRTLSQAMTRLIELKPQDNIYSTIAEGLRLLVGPATIIINAFDPQKNELTTRAFLGTEAVRSAASQALGVEPEGTKLTVMPENLSVMENSMTPVPGGLWGLVFGQIPRDVCKKIEEDLGITEVRVMPFATGVDILGTAAVLVGKGGAAVPWDLVEIFIRQAAMATQRKRAEAELEESERKYRQIVETANEGIWMTDANDKTGFVNARMAQMLRRDPKEMIGQSLLKHFLKEDIPVIKKQLAIRKKGHPGKYEVRIRRKDGQIIWVYVAAVPILDDRNLFLGSFGMFTDINMRKRTEEALRNSESKLTEQNLLLDQKNAALKELIDQLKSEKERVERKVKDNVDHLLIPLIKRLESKRQPQISSYTRIIESNLRELTSTFGTKISDEVFALTKREMEIANLVKSGITSKEIAHMLGISVRSVETHRNNIRKKLKIDNRDINLATYLSSLK